MKHLIFFCFPALIFAYSTFTYAQCTDEIFLYSQEDVDNFMTDYGCTQINGNLILGGENMIEMSDITNLNGLNELTSITGYLLIHYNESLVNLTGLQNLTSVGNGITIYENPAINNFIGLQNLTNIEGDFYIASNPVLLNMEGLENLETIEGKLHFDANHGLINLFGLENLTHIQGTLRVFDMQSIVNLTGLEHLISIQSLSISECYSILNLEGLENLVNIEVRLGISECYNFSSLEGLESVETIGEINLSGCSNLVNLEGLNNLTFVNGDASINNNSNLVTCCNALNLLNKVQGILDIRSNAPTCSSLDTIITLCRGPQIEIQTFYDENENGLLDSDEQNNQQAFTIEPTVPIAFTNESGLNYFYLKDFGNYQISLNNINPLWTYSEIETIDIEYLDTTFNDTTIYFPVVPIADFNIQRVDLSSSITRCNQATNYWLTYSNEGTTINSGYIELVPYESATFVSANPPVDSIAGDKLYWFYENLYPTHFNQIHLVYQMPGVENEEDLGTAIVFEAQVQTNEGLGDNKAILSSELICAYDPNDKLVTPFGYTDDNYTLFDDTLEYTVRFQNTGNDTAFTVVIKDRLSEYLDLNTFRPIASSHPVQTQVNSENRLVFFTFNDIYLPDSNINEVGSHGFVKYRILGKEGLNENTDIKNTASIFFDQNPPIITNTVSNRMVEELPSFPVLSATPNELDFGEIALDEVTYLLPQILLVNNLGDLPLHIEEFNFQSSAFNSDQIQNIVVEGLSSVEVPIYFEPTQEGNYQSELILKGPDGELTILLNGTATTNTGISQVGQEYFGLFPNPNNGQFYLEAKNGQVLSYQIQNSLGQSILQGTQINNVVPIDLTKQAKGIYFISVETSEGVFVEKIVVQ